MSPYVPLSVREGNRRKKFGWWLKLRREALALRLAPWLIGAAKHQAWLEELAAKNATTQKQMNALLEQLEATPKGSPEWNSIGVQMTGLKHQWLIDQHAFGSTTPDSAPSTGASPEQKGRNPNG